MIRIDGSGCLMPKPESANIAHAILLYIEPVQMVFENMDTLDSELAVQHDFSSSSLSIVKPIYSQITFSVFAAQPLFIESRTMADMYRNIRI